MTRATRKWRDVQNRKRSVFQRSARIVAVSKQPTSQASLAVSIRALRQRRSVCGSVLLDDPDAQSPVGPTSKSDIPIDLRSAIQPSYVAPVLLRTPAAR